MCDGAAFFKGAASGGGCNCLIDTLRQSLDLSVHVAEVRARLEALHRRRGTPIAAVDYLEFEHHALDILGIFREPKFACGRVVPDAARMRLICVDLTNIGHGDVVGPDGDNCEGTICLARENQNHFVPCIPDRNGRSGSLDPPYRYLSLAALYPHNRSGSSATEPPSSSTAADGLPLPSTDFSVGEVGETRTE